FLDSSSGKESYSNLQKAERVMEELWGLDCREIADFRVSERDLMAAFGRASLQNNKFESAARYFKKAIEATISAGVEMAPELINLYQEMAETEQLKKNHEKAIAYSTSTVVYNKFSLQTASVSLLLAKAYAATGDEKYVEAAEKYFTEGFAVYKEALGMDHFQTINAVEDYSKWLAQTGKRKVTTDPMGLHHMNYSHAKGQGYSFLKEWFKLQQDPCRDFNEQAIERLYIMGCICLAEEKIREAHLLLSKVITMFLCDLFDTLN
ncbi:hypothetical protein JD844_008415, partial [Phrynosoma platyrhinos]